MKLDDTDQALIQLLRQNARLTNKDIAAKLGVAASTALERTRRLQEAGVITGYHAEADAKSVGVLVQAMISVRLAKHTRKAFSDFMEHMQKQDAVIAVYQLAGHDDFLVHVGTHTVEQLSDFTFKTITGTHDIAHTETRLIFDYVRSANLPVYLSSDE